MLSAAIAQVSDLQQCLDESGEHFGCFLSLQRWRTRREHGDRAAEVLNPLGALQLAGLESHAV